jgi:hypothetical protein
VTRVKKTVIFLTVCLLFSALSWATQGDQEQLIRQVPVPPEPPYQGEVRLLRRNSSQVVQTILHSKVMNHVIAAIQKKELRDWPAGREGSLDSRRYTEELVQSYQLLRQRAKKREQASDRHLQLIIEFVLEGKRGHVALYVPTLTQEGDRFVVQKKELLKKLPLSYDYLHKNMQFIVQENFQLDAGKATALLQQAAGE